MYLHRTNTLHSLLFIRQHPPYQHNISLCNGRRVTSTRLHTSHTHNHMINTYTRHTAHPFRVPRIRSCSTPRLLLLHAPVTTLVRHVGRISRSSTVTSRVLRWHSHSRACGQHQLRLGHDHRRLLFRLALLLTLRLVLLQFVHFGCVLAGHLKRGIQLVNVFIHI